MKDDRKQLLKGLFKNHPKTVLFYVTSDDQAFFEKHHAEGHAHSLPDKTVTPCLRAVFEKVTELEEQKAAGDAQDPEPSRPVEPQAPTEQQTAAALEAVVKVTASVTEPIIEPPVVVGPPKVPATPRTKAPRAPQTDSATK